MNWDQDQIQRIFCNKMVLAPLVGGSDLSYRLLARRYGAQLTFTEMNIAEYYHSSRSDNGPKKYKENYVYEFDASDRPLVLQLAGNTSDPIIQLANQDFLKGNIDAVDLNCGCPQGFAMEKGIGAALLRNPDRLVDLAKEISQSIPYPMSMKLRLLEDGLQSTIGLISKLASHSNVQAFTIHGRYWWQKGEKRGENDWNAIKMIREAIPRNIPIIGNGDVRKFEDFEKFQTFSGVDSVMVGYGALRNPTLFQNDQILNIEDIVQDYLAIAMKHQNGFIDIQRHIHWLIKSKCVGMVEFKSKLFQCSDLQGLQKVLATIQPNPINIQIPVLLPGVQDSITYPPKPEQMSAKQLKSLKRRQIKNEIKLSKKLKRHESANPEALHEFSSDAPPLSKDEDLAKESGNTIINHHNQYKIGSTLDDESEQIGMIPSSHSKESQIV